MIIIEAGINGASAGLAYALHRDLKKKQVLIVEKNQLLAPLFTIAAEMMYPSF